MAHTSLDLETLGLKPGCVIRSIGAVALDPDAGTRGAIFYRNVTVESCLAAGLTIDPDTQAWWDRQSPEARAALEDAQVPLAQALADFAAFYELYGGRLWCKGPSFDAVVLEAAYAAVGADPPWRYSDPRDIRTICELAGVEIKHGEKTLHNALDDAIAQADAVIAAYDKLGIAKRPEDPIFDGRGAPITFYDKKDHDWPAQWRLPEDIADEDGDLFGKLAHLTDDLALRSAVNVWDNALRAPGAFEGIAGGLLSAHARFVSPAVNDDLEKAADGVREGWLGMARQAQALAAQAAKKGQAVRTCKHCGCTEDRACETPAGPCSWILDDVCSAPGCMEKAAVAGEAGQ